MRTSISERAIQYAILSAFALFAVLPLIGVVISSVTPTSEDNASFRIPSRVEWANFAEAWTTGGFGPAMLSSLVSASLVVVCTSMLAFAAAYSFAFYRFRGSTALFYLLLLGLLVPIEGYVVPLFYNLRDAGLAGTYVSLVLPQVAQSLGFAIFWMRNNFKAIPREMIEAARIDGASEVRVLWSIVLPSSVSAILTMTLLLFMWGWNEFLLALVMVASSPLRTAPLGLTFFTGQYTTAYNLTAAAGVIVALPVIVLFFILQRRFMEGMLGGAVK